MPEQNPDSTETVAASPAPVSAIQLADREQLRASLRPTMSPGSFTNWLFRAMKDNDFPQPVRVGRRSCAWRVVEVTAWLEGRPRKGVFASRRPGR